MMLLASDKGESDGKNDASRHRTMVASHTATPLGVAKWLVRGYNKNNSLPLGRRHGLLVSLTCVALVPYLKARFRVWVSPSPAISQSPGGQLYGWLPLSNASGISSVAKQHKIKRLRHFHSLRTKHVLPDFRIRQYETIYL